MGNTVITLTALHSECQHFNGALYVLEWERCSCQECGCAALLSETEMATLKILFARNNFKLAACDSLGSVTPLLTHSAVPRYCQCRIHDTKALKYHDNGLSIRS